MTDKLYETGIANRRKVLGDAHVDRSLASANEFTLEMQELVTRFCWGEVWNREGLSLRDRSLINLSMMTALNRHHEFKVHVRGAINNGVTVAEIKEVLLQASVYCGAPAGLESFRLANEVLVEMGEA